MPDNMTPPTHGPTGSPVVDYDMTTRNELVEHRYLPPSPPMRTVDVYDEFQGDGEVIGYRTLSDEEFAQATQAYEQRSAEYKLTGGIHRTQGQVRITIKVTCADGTTAEGECAGKEWLWTSWETPARP